MKCPVLVAVKQNWVRMWQSPNHEGGRVREIKLMLESRIHHTTKSQELKWIFLWLRIDHSNLTHAYLIEELVNLSVCDLCKSPITVDHSKKLITNFDEIFPEGRVVQGAIITF